MKVDFSLICVQNLTVQCPTLQLCNTEGWVSNASKTDVAARQVSSIAHLFKLGNLQTQHETDPLQHLRLALRLSLQGASPTQYAAGHVLARFTQTGSRSAGSFNHSKRCARQAGSWLLYHATSLLVSSKTTIDRGVEAKRRLQSVTRRCEKAWSRA